MSYNPTSYSFSSSIAKAIISIACIIPLLCTTAAAQANFDSRSSGVWNASSSWTLVSGTDGDGVPDADDNATIKNGYTVTIGNTNRNCANLIVDAGGTLSVDGTGNIRINANPGSATINGTIIMSSSGNLQETGNGTRSLIVGNGGTLTIGGTAAFPPFDSYAFDPNSTAEFMASGNQNVQSGMVYGNVTIGGSGKKTVAPLPPDTAFTSNGTLTINSGVTFDVSTNILYAHFNGNVLINGTLDISVGIVVVEMQGAFWTNNGSYLPSVTPGFGHQPTITFYNTQIGGSTSLQKFFDVIFTGNTSALASIDSARNIEIKPGATFSGGASTTHKLTGNWLNNGTYNSGTATVSLIGTTAQTLTGSTFNNLVINNTSGVTLSGNVDIASGGTLTLLNGNLTTGSYFLTINNPSASALVLGSNRILGNITRAVAGGATSQYNFLSANTFVVPNGINNPSSISVAEFPNTNPPNLGPAADTNRVVKRYYSITQSGAGSGFTFSLRLPYLQSEVRGNEAGYELYRNGGTGWIDVGSIIADVNNNYVQQDGLTEFSDWAIAEGGGALPIQIAHLSASVVQNSNDVLVLWGTITETNNYGFFVQRSSTDESNYTDLPNSFVPGHGTTIEPREYQWTDTGVLQGTYYYRLKQIDLDGSIHFTDGVLVHVSTFTSAEETVPAVFGLAQNYPNPFNPSTVVGFTVEERTLATLTVYDLLGQEIVTLFSGIALPGQRYDLRFDGADLTNGIYVARLQTETKSALQKMLLLK